MYERRDVDALHHGVVGLLVECLNRHFEVDADLLPIMKSFASLEASVNLEAIQKLLGTDLGLAELLLQLDNVSDWRKDGLQDDINQGIQKCDNQGWFGGGGGCLLKPFWWLNNTFQCLKYLNKNTKHSI